MSQIVPIPVVRGTVTRTYRLEDVCGNWVEVTQSILIADDVAPTADALADMGPYACYADIPSPDVSVVQNAADNCGLDVTVSHVSDSADPGCTGTVTRTYRVEDNCGNFIEVTQNISINDDVAPTADALADIGPFSCYADIPSPDVSVVQNEADNCGLPVTVSHVSDSADPGCTGTVVRTYRVEDDCGNFIEVTQNISINDDVVPTADPLPNLGPFACYGDIPAPNSSDVPNAADNCGLAVTVSHISDSADPGCTGTVTRTYRVEDVCGNFIEVTQEISINDDVAPTADALPDLGPYACYADIPAANITDVQNVTDNCGLAVTVSHVSDSADPGCVGTVTRTYRLEDVCGNWVEVTQSILIADDVAPTADALADMGPYACYADIPSPDVSVVQNEADNCGLPVTVSHVSDSGDPGCTGTVTRTYRVEDNCGNFIEVTQNISINDDVAPTADPLPNLGPFSCYADIPSPDVSAVQNEADNCGLPVTVSHVSDSADPGCTGTVVRTYRVEDDCGNFIEVTQNILIADDVNPTADALPAIGPYACYGDIPAPNSSDVPNAADNCGLAVTVSHISDSADPGCTGTVTRTYRVEDVCGNFIEVTQEISINDDVAPTADALPDLGPYACYADIPAANITDVQNVTDNCGLAVTVSHVSDSGDPGCVGTVTRTYRLEDVCGNWVEVTQSILIADDVAPTADALADMGPYACYADIPSPDVSVVQNAVDNCGLAVTVSHVSDSADPGCTGTVTRTYRVEDNCGNFIEVTQNISINDDVAPTADALADIGPYACYADIPSPDVSVVQNEADNCGLPVTVSHVSDSADPGCTGTVVRTYRVEDDCGNFIEVTQNISINDDVVPTADPLPNLGPFACYGDIPAPNSSDVPNAADNCGLAVTVSHISDSADPGCTGTVTRTYRVEDVCGNFIEVTQEISINDDVAPTADALPDLGPYACYGDIPAANITDVQNVTDNCGLTVTVSHVSDSGDPGCVGTVTRTYRLEDVCGNWVEVTQSILIADDVAPTADALADMGPYACYADIPSPDVSVVQNAADNCGLDVTVSHVSDSADPGCTGTVTRTYRVEDNCGNFIEVTQNISINDDVAPTADALADIGPYACYADIPSPDVSVVQNEADNCGLPVTVSHVSDSADPGCTGTVVRTYRVEDDCGNFIEVTQNISINDDVVPTADPLPNLGPFACYGDIPAPNSSDVPNAADNCGLAVTVSHISDSADPGCTGTVTRTYRVEDNCGNFIEVTQEISINDDVAPTADALPDLGPYACYADIPAANITDVQNVTDNCGLAVTVSHVSDSGDPGCVGTVTRTYRLEDVCGNWVEVTQSILIADDVAPTADALADMGPYACYADIPSPDVSVVQNAADNCGLDVTVSHVSDSADPGCTGTVTRTYRVEDNCGNFIEMTQNISINDDVAPTADALADIGPFSCYADIPSPDVSVVQNEADNCGLPVTVSHVSDSADPGCTGTVVRTYRVEDDCGNFIEVTQNISINDDVVPTADPLPNLGPFACYGDIPAPNSSDVPNAADNCGLAVTVSHISDSADPGCTGTVTRTYRVEDNCGNFIEVTQEISINDDVAPTADALPDLGPYACYADIPAANIADITGVTDNCGLAVTVSHVSDSGDPGCVGTVTRTYRLEDVCGNWVEVTQSILIADDVAPTADALVDIGPYACYADIPSPDVSVVQNAADNCGLDVTVSHVSDSADPGCTGTVIRTYRVEDNCGNFIEVTQNISINDDVAPTADPLPNLGPYACYADIPSPDVSVVQNEADNCGLPVTVSHVSDSADPGCTGTVVRTYRVEDDCGNFIEVTQNISINDDVVPTADPLPNLGPFACYGDIPAPNSSDVPNAADNCGLVVTVSHISDSADPGCTGTVTRTYRVEDVCGNFIEVTQEISINDDVAPTADALPDLGPYACYGDIPAANIADITGVTDNCGLAVTVSHVSDSADPGCVGTVTRTYRLEDVCGNWVEVTQSILIADDVAPTADALADMGPYACYADIPSPDVSVVQNAVDNCGLDVTVSHVSDSADPGCTGTVIRTYRVEDNCGNFIEVTQNISINDDVAPTADPLPNLGPYACYADIPSPDVSVVQNEADNCGLPVTVSHVSDSADPGCTGTVVRTYRVEDDCGNFIEVTQNISINDDVVPTADPLPNLGPFACYGDIPAPNSSDVPNAADNCGLAVTVSHISDSADPGCTGTVTRTYRVEDVCGNFIEVTQEISINDDVAPTADALPDLGPYACYADIPAANIADVTGVTDNCGLAVTVSHVSDSGDPGCVGTVTRTYRLEDVCGNWVEVTQSILIADDVAPTADALADMGPYACYADIPSPDVSVVQNAADNCGLDVTVSHVSDSADPGCTGTVTRTYRVEDNCGNFIEMTQNISINDDVAPTADALADIGPFSCYADIPSPDVSVVQNEADNCGLPVTVSHVSDSADPGCTGTVVRTYRVEDDCGNFIEVTQNISINDDVVPTADPLPNLGPFACYGDIPAPNSSDVPNAADNCGLAVTVSHISDSADPGCTGTVTRTYRVEDVCGNFIEVTQEISINDDVAPTADVLPDLGPYACYGDIPAANIADVTGVTDNCGLAVTVNHVSDSADPGCVGTVTRTYRLEDVCGNWVEVTQSILIADDVAPTADALADIGPYACYADIPSPDVSVVQNAVDNCGLTVTVSHVSDSADPGCTGTVTRTYRVEDNCGNFIEVTQNISINDDVAPTADPLPNLGPYACYADIPSPDVSVVQNEADNCGLPVTVSHVSDSADPGCTGTVVRTYRVEDDCGNFIEVTQNILIADDVNPTADALPAIGPYACYGDIPAPNSSDVPNAADNCGLAVTVSHISDSADPGCTGTVTRTYRVEDVCGNFIEVTQTIFLNDDVAPTADALPDLGPYACYGDIPAANIADITGVTDNCGLAVTVSHVSDSGDPGCVGTVTRTYRIEDVCGNSIEVTQSIVIEDNVAPTADALPDIGPYACYRDIPAPDITVVQNAMDNCGLAVTVTHISDSPDPGCTGTVIRIYQVEDACGNFIELTQNIAIQDDIPPIANPLADMGPYACYRDIPAPTISVIQDENDNCRLSVVVSHVSDSPDPGCTGTVVRTYRVEDVCGNFIEVTQNILINDNVPPTADPLLDIGPFACYADIPAPNSSDVLNAIDNCGQPVSISHVSDSPDPGCTGTVTRTYRVEDVCGNFIEVTQNILINDNVPPTADALPDLGPYACYADIPAANIAEVTGLTDNCGLSITVSHVSDGANPGCTGTVTRTYRIEDVCGNFSNITQNILINDNEIPTADPLPDLGPYACYSDIPSPDITVVQNATDNCDSPVNIRHLADFPDPGCIGVVVRNYRVEDRCGNFIDLFQNIYINDDVPPTADPLPDLGPFICRSEIPAPDLNAIQGLADNCGGGVSVSFLEDTPLEGCVGTIIRVYEIEDPCGNTSTINQNILLNDTEPPSLQSPASDMTVTCAENGNSNGLVENWLANNGEAIANNSCGAVTWTNDYTTLSDLCGSTGSIMVTFTYSDECGNAATTAATFSVIDNTPPSFITVPEDLTVECSNVPEPPITNVEIVAEDDCGTAVITMEEQREDGPCANIYTLIRTWTATDECDNTSFASQMITVIDCGPEATAGIDPNKAVCIDEALTLEVHLTQGYDNPVYQWQISMDAQSWTDISGANNAVYLINNATLADIAWYQVIVANAVGDLNNPECSVISTAVMVEVYSPIEPINLIESICEGESFMVGDMEYTTTGNYEQTLVASNGCDSLVTLDLVVHSHTSTELTEAICEGETFIVGNTPYSETGIYTTNLQTIHGCDSIVTLDLSILPILNTSFEASICEGEIYPFGNNLYSESGSYTQTFTASTGCDSLVTLFLTAIPPTIVTLEEQICVGETYMVGNESFDATGTYQVFLETSLACDSIVVLNLEVLEDLRITLNESICEGETYEISEFIYQEAGTYQVSLTSSGGCDSIVTLNLEVVSVLVTDLNEVVCEGESISIGTTDYFNTGSFSETLTSSGGCDSIVNLDLLVHPRPVVTLEESICHGEVFPVGNSVYSESGSYTNILTSNAGCDSTVHLNLTVLPLHTVNRDTSICEGQSVIFEGMEFFDLGVYTIDFIDDEGCNALIVLTVNIQEEINVILDASICVGQEYTVGTETFDTEGSYTIALTTQETDCDSIVTLNLSVEPGLSTDLDESICQGSSFEMGGVAYNETGIYTADLTAEGGCDSTVTLNLLVLDEININLEESICEGAVFMVGTSAYTETGVYTDILTSSGGCDSIVVLDLTVNTSLTTEITEEICDGELVEVGGETFGTTGLHSVTIEAVNGCDSTIHLDLLVHSNENVVLNEIICAGQSIKVGEETFSNGGTYTIDLQTEMGCDSTITLNLTVAPGLAVLLNETICENESFEMGGNLFDETGTYITTLTAQGGCDSTVTLNLIVIEKVSFNLVEEICEGNSFVVGSSVYIQNQVYILIHSLLQMAAIASLRLF